MSTQSAGFHPADGADTSGRLGAQVSRLPTTARGSLLLLIEEAQRLDRLDASGSEGSPVQREAVNDAHRRICKAKGELPC